MTCASFVPSRGAEGRGDALWIAPADAQTFLLVGTLFLLPIILMYTAWSYWVFRGKVRADIGYH